MIFVCLFLLFLELLCLFVVSDFLETEEIFTRLFVKFTVNEIDNVLDPGDLNEFQSVNSSVGDFEGDVQSNELCLQGSNCDQHLQESDECFTSAVDGLTTTGKTEQSGAFFLLVLTSERENWKFDTRNVFSMNVHAHISPGLNVIKNVS
jgi:hypothetical protein